MPHDYANEIVEFTNRILESSNLDLTASAEPTDDGFTVAVDLRAVAF